MRRSTTHGVRPGDLACFIYTAGTTGPSKGCMLSHNYVVSLADQIARAWQRRPDDIVLTPLPLFHFNAISVCVVGSLVTGGSAAIVRRFSVSNFWPEVQRPKRDDGRACSGRSRFWSRTPMTIPTRRVTVFGSARRRRCRPTPIARGRNASAAKRSAAATASPKRRSLCMLNAGEPNKPGAMGKPNRDEFDIRIVDDDDNEVPIGETGEIVCRPNGPNLMFAGYWNNADATVEATRNLWFHTGDLARLDDDDYAYFVDRRKDALRRRGENISSFEMEKVLFGHDAVRDAAVHAVPSPLGEDDVKVTVVLQADATISEEDLCRWVAERVPYFAIPRYIEFRDDLPRNPVGRVLKYQLRDEGVTGQTWDREAAGVEFDRR